VAIGKRGVGHMFIVYRIAVFFSPPINTSVFVYRSGALSTQDKTALYDFVSDGGSLIISSDELLTVCVKKFKVAEREDASCTSVISVSNLPPSLSEKNVFPMFSPHFYFS
jgi:hypothetical protein